MSKLGELAPAESRQLDKLLAIGGCSWVQDNNYFTIEQFDQKSNAWQLLHKVPGFREEFGIELIDNTHLIVMGGRNEKNLTVDNVINFNLNTFEVIDLPPLILEKHAFATVNIDNQIYVMGGAHMCTPVIFDSVERYNVESQKWYQLASMQNPRQFAAASNLNGKLFVTGGCDVNLEATNSVEYYAQELDKWLEVAPMNEKRARHGCKVINGSLYVFGGCNRFEAIKVIERYDEVANKWFTIALTPEVASNELMSINLNDCLFAPGEEDRNKMTFQWPYLIHATSAKILRLPSLLYERSFFNNILVQKC